MSRVAEKIALDLLHAAAPTGVSPRIAACRAETFVSVAHNANAATGGRRPGHRRGQGGAAHGRPSRTATVQGAQLTEDRRHGVARSSSPGSSDAQDVLVDALGNSSRSRKPTRACRRRRRARLGLHSARRLPPRRARARGARPAAAPRGVDAAALARLPRGAAVRHALRVRRSPELPRSPRPPAAEPAAPLLPPASSAAPRPRRARHAAPRPTPHAAHSRRRRRPTRGEEAFTCLQEALHRLDEMQLDRTAPAVARLEARRTLRTAGARELGRDKDGRLVMLDHVGGINFDGIHKLSHDDILRNYAHRFERYDGASSPSRARSASTRTTTRRWSTSRGSASATSAGEPRDHQGGVQVLVGVLPRVGPPHLPDQRAGGLPDRVERCRSGSTRSRRRRSRCSARTTRRNSRSCSRVDVPESSRGRPTPRLLDPAVSSVRTPQRRVHCVLSGAPSRARRCRLRVSCVFVTHNIRKILRRRQSGPRPATHASFTVTVICLQTPCRRTRASRSQTAA